MDNDQSEYERRAHAYEMGGDVSDAEWDRWSQEVEQELLKNGATTLPYGLDGDEATDGFSMDYAYDAFERGDSPEQYLDEVFEKRAERGL